MVADPVPAAANGSHCRAMLLHLLLATAILVTPSASHAQEVGDYMRVTTQGGWVAGEVLRVGDAGFEMGLPGGGSHSVLRADILLLERRVTGSHAKGAAIGGGAALGLLFGFAALALADLDLSCFSYCDDDDGNMGDLGYAVLGFLAGGTIGAALGAAVGSAFKWTRWESIAIAGGRPMPAIGLAVGGGRVGVELGGRLRF